MEEKTCQDPQTCDEIEKTCDSSAPKECSDAACSDSACEDGYCDMSRTMAHLADQAWADLMLDKMKKAWEEKRGADMDKMAAVAVEHSMAVWKGRMDAKDMRAKPSKEMVEEFKKKLQEAMM